MSLVLSVRSARSWAFWSADREIAERPLFWQSAFGLRARLRFKHGADVRLTAFPGEGNLAATLLQPCGPARSEFIDTVRARYALAIVGRFEVPRT